MKGVLLQVALNLIPSVLSVGPSSAGREAFTESTDTVFHFLVSRLLSISAAVVSSSTLGLPQRPLEHVHRDLYLVLRHTLI